ncbi:hypothetical protein CAPTEDRAFT_204006 [Capitella teleta]|uniref:Uncharacterized protein n=1 Tax=Capitella teleta TaxID=283909 RepID=R7V3H3_CAPTE|nr:hypothetical protein CAPTEDRAFT_204006 [Capitella teleta]|eukprot:ELU10350.1 hypothetical protein CAPTEDRAFT_204006 [Capitella teleta]
MEYKEKLLCVVICVVQLSQSDAFQEITVQTCDNEVFQARCPYSQALLITQAKYGHIETSRCVDDIFEELGSLGCYANITELIGSRCNSKNKCEIDGEDTDVMSSKSCKKGLPMYMDISYVCLPDTTSIRSCEAVSVNRQIQYLLSKDIWDHHCFYDLEQNTHVEFSAEANLKIKINVQYVVGEPDSAIDDAVYVTDRGGNTVALSGEFVEIVSGHLTLTLTNMHNIVLIGFQAIGCDDPATPAYAWVSREGDMATIGCYHSEYEWKMSCVGSKWIGPRSNCTDKQQDILFALIIGLTVLLCAIVITVGYVCLKRSKYTYEAKSAPYEMATMMSDPSNTATWQKAKLQGNNDTLILPVNSLQGQTLQLR